MLRWTLGSFALLLLWDALGLDLAVAQWFASSNGFAYKDHWLWLGILHDDARWLGWSLALALLLAVGRPFGPLKQLTMTHRVQLALGTLAALLVISSLKLHSSISCPWDLKQFGGTANYVSHWAWSLRDGGPGHCFPAGHASAGFAFASSFFVFRRDQPCLASRCLAMVMLTGLLLGLAQQIRGAHYMSHTLWTAWICWACAALIDLGFKFMSRFNQWLLQKPSRVPAPAPGFLTAGPSRPLP